MAFAIKPLDPQTWPDFAALAERSNGVWGGCWCMAFHPEGVGRGRTAEGNRAAKEMRVREGRAHAALVFDGTECLGWCQFGSPAELPGIKLQKIYGAGDEPTADWRITCFFIDKSERRRGIAAAALAGALDLIAGLGGGVVESFPEHAEARRVSPSFLYNGELRMFERLGFARVRPLGRTHWLVRRTIA
jgi:GNAT superfamily N-acetyltransferase